MNFFTPLSKPILEAVYEINRRNGIGIDKIDAIINSTYNVKNEYERALSDANIEANYLLAILPFNQKIEMVKSCKLLINDLTSNSIFKPSGSIRIYTQMLLSLIMNSKAEEYDSAMKSAAIVVHISEQTGDEGLLLWCHFCIEDLCKIIGPRII